MSALSEILSSRSRAEIFRLLFGPTPKELHIREIQRQSGLNDSTIRQELQKLARLDLVTARKDSNRIYYKANPSNPLFMDLRNLVLKTVGLVDILKEALQEKGILLAFVFGSVAEGKERVESDVDLFVIADSSLRTLSMLLSGISEKLGREVNPHVMTPVEFSRRVKSGEHFIANIVKSPKLYVIGTEYDFETMGR